MSIFTAWAILAPVVIVPAIFVGIATHENTFIWIGDIAVVTQLISLIISRRYK